MSALARQVGQAARGRTSRTGRRIDGPSLAVVALVAAGLTLGLSAAPTRAAEPVPPADSLCSTASRASMPLRWLLDLRTASGPLGERYGLALNERALYCYGGHSLTVTAFDVAPEGLGGAVPYAVSPGWLDTWLGAGAYLSGSDIDAAPGAPAGPFLQVSVPPRLVARFTALHGRWVTVTLHFDDPAARGCHYSESTVSPGADGVPTLADLVALCRQSPVLSSIEAARCPRLPSTLSAIASVPQVMLAHCFGRREVTFTARGGSVTNVWPGLNLPPGTREWWVRDTAGRTVSIFVPAEVALPDPAGTPWEGRDGVGGPDDWWRLTGHFADPGAGTCTASDDDLVAGVDFSVTISRQPSEAEAFCRDHLVVDRLTWLKTPPTDTDPTVAADGSGGEPSTGGPLAILVVTFALAVAFGLASARFRSPLGAAR